MNLLSLALRRPITILVAIVAIGMGCWLAVQRTPVDIFPKLNLPVIYVCQPYGGMDPAQMEGFLTNYYEYHFLYITGIHHVESRNVQGMALMRIYFHPGTDMSQAMAETINYVNRSRAFMPPGTVSPFVMRFDTGSVPVGYMVMSSDTRSINDIQDIALFKVRPKFSSLPGVSAPPPFGGSQRSVVVTVDPEKLRAYGLSPDDLVAALGKSNTITPSGNMPIGDQYPIVPVNSVVKDVRDLESTPIRTDTWPQVYLRDLGYVQDTADAPVGYALVNGRRAVYILANKRADASTLSVVQAIKTALPGWQKELPEDIKVSFEFDQSPFVTKAVQAVASEGALGAALVGLMVLIFLRSIRSALIIVLNIPLALASSLIALWLSGYTINIMTLGGLALAIGILVDEATVSIENIHTHLARGKSLASAVRDGSAETQGPRFLAMLAILAVFIPAIFMPYAAQGMFLPLALAVGFSMFASYILSSTFVPVMAVWILPRQGKPHAERGLFRRMYEGLLRPVVALRWILAPAYLAACAWVVVFIGGSLGTEIFPTIDTGQFRMRLRAPDGMHINKTEKIAVQALDLLAGIAGKENVELTVGYVGGIHSSYPVNGVYQWSRGPEEAIIRVGLRPGSGINVEDLKEKLRNKMAEAMPQVRASFEPADIINEVMSFGSPTPVEVSVNGSDLKASRGYMDKLRGELARIPSLRDLQFAQSLDYPTIEVNVDRMKAGLSGVTTSDVARNLATITSSTRFITPIFWADPKSGIGYQIQLEIPRTVVRDPRGMAAAGSMEDIKNLPVRGLGAGSSVYLRDVADVTRGSMPGQYDRYNMKRQIGLTANFVHDDLGNIAKQVRAAIGRAGDLPKDATLDVRGQIPIMEEMLGGLRTGLLLAVLVIFLLLAANFQSIPLSLAAVSTAPAAVAGAVIALKLTGVTLNIQSFTGAIMAIGVAMANAILLVTFAERDRRAGAHAADAAVSGAGSRLRPILMTSFAMIAGMIPMAMAYGEAGQQNAPLGKAVIGGLIGATLATLFILPGVFALLRLGVGRRDASLDPADPASRYYDAQPSSRI